MTQWKDLSPEDRREVATRAAKQLEQDLQLNAPALAAVLEATLDDEPDATGAHVASSSEGWWVVADKFTGTKADFLAGPYRTRELAEKSNQWRAEVTTYDDGGAVWYSNGRRFPTKAEGLEYVQGLARRWTSVTRWRVVPPTTPEREAYAEGSEDGKW